MLKLANKYFLSTLLCLSLTCQAAFALAPDPKPLEGSQVGLAYKLPNSDQVYGMNIDTYYHPASTQKILTALSALIYLGPDYELTTKLDVSRDVIAGNNTLRLEAGGVLNSDVVIKFTGDPTMRVDHYRTLLSVLKTHKVNRIKGKVLLDVTRFGGPSRADGWSWSDLPACFTAPSAPIILNRNCTFAQLSSTEIGGHPAPLIPKSVPIDITADVVTVSANDYGGDCILEANLFIDNKYHVKGCIPYQKDKKPWPLSLAIADAERWGVDWTKQLLKELKITVDGGVEILRTPVQNTVSIAQRSSPKLSELVKYMLQKSNNLYADSIAKNIAAEYFDLPATYYRANRAMRSILKQYADIDLGNVYIVDGSGLSPHNLINPRIMLKMLDYINKHNDKLGLIEMLPVSGKSGTLHWRVSTFNEPLKEKVFAKTGTLQNVSSLAGFVITKSGARTPFVLFTNSITYPESTREMVKYRRKPSPHYAHERYLLEAIYNEQIIRK